MRASDLGLPDKFDTGRFAGQLEIACDAVASDRRFHFLDAATGVGKSVTAIAAARLHGAGARTLVLTGTKQLQSQYLRDFADVGMRDIRGHSNYRCAVQGAPRWEPPCRFPKDQCLYRVDGERSKASDLVVTNYAYWLTLGRYGDPATLGAFDFLVVDEAHTAAEWLTDWCAVEVDRADLRVLLDDPKIDLPWGAVTNGVAPAWCAWADTMRRRLTDRYAVVRQLKESRAMDPVDATALLAKINALDLELCELARSHEMDTRWVAEKIVARGRNAVRWSPVWPRDYAERYLFRRIPSVLLTSATLFPRYVARHLGIGSADMSVREVPSPFAISRRPVIYLAGSQRIDRRLGDVGLQLWVNRIDAIIDGRLDRKGIVHTKSYKRALDFAARSRHRAILLTHETRTTADTVARFKSAPAPCVLVSPSVAEGQDFPLDECRYVVVAKVPFADTRDPVTAARAAEDRDYLNYLAAMEIVQMAGRGVRSADDMAETFIVDAHWEWFRRKAKFPKWFEQAWSWADAIPDAPSLEVVR